MDTAMLTALRLSKAGYGTPTEILRMPVDVVVAAMEFEAFQNDYESTVRELNKS